MVELEAVLPSQGLCPAVPLSKPSRSAVDKEQGGPGECSVGALLWEQEWGSTAGAALPWSGGDTPGHLFGLAVLCVWTPKSFAKEVIAGS